MTVSEIVNKSEEKVSDVQIERRSRNINDWVETSDLKAVSKTEKGKLFAWGSRMFHRKHNTTRKSEIIKHSTAENSESVKKHEQKVSNMQTDEEFNIIKKL